MQKTKKRRTTYASERKRFMDWLDTARHQVYLESFDGSKEGDERQFPEILKNNGSYNITTDHKAETVEDGYAYMMTGLLNGMNFCRYAEDAKEVVKTALQGYDMFFPAGGDCRPCDGKGKLNRTILKGIVKADTAFNINSIDNSWFYVSSDSIFSRPAAVCFGVFDVAALLEQFINVIIGEGSGEDRAAIVGAKKALQDVWMYFKANKPKKVSVEKMVEGLFAGEIPYGGLWGSFYEYQGQELLSEEDYTDFIGDQVEYESMEEAMEGITCPGWDEMEEITGLLINKALSFDKMTRDMRSGYLFFMSNMRNWISSMKGSSDTAFPLVSALEYLISGIDRLENPFYYNGEKTEREVHYYELLNAMMMEKEPVLDEKTWMEILNPTYPQCSILSDQITAVTTLLLCSETFFGLPYLPVTAGVRQIDGIDNVGDRMEGIIGAMADLLNSTGLTSKAPIYADIREKNYHDIIHSLIDCMTIFEPDAEEGGCEEA